MYSGEILLLEYSVSYHFSTRSVLPSKSFEIRVILWKNMENIAKKVNLKRLGNTKEYLKGLQELKKRAVQELHKNYS